MGAGSAEFISCYSPSPHCHSVTSMGHFVAVCKALSKQRYGEVENWFPRTESLVDKWLILHYLPVGVSESLGEP